MISNELHILFNNAIDKLRKCFGGIDVNVKHDSIIIINPNINDSIISDSYTIKHIGVKRFGISIEIEGEEVLLTEDYAHDILLYGNVVSEEFVRPFICNEKMKVYERSLKINKLKKL